MSAVGVPDNRRQGTKKKTYTTTFEGAAVVDVVVLDWVMEN
jgi:hypothetical protein